ncbi:MAG: glycosyltransferase family 9 protein [Chloroflexi bacterium]|nr:glycosyltransferase family 9 protein [Chloroflexota bacterium]
MPAPQRLLMAVMAAGLAGLIGYLLRPRAPRHATRSAVLPLWPERVLVVKLADIGDALGIEPALASLRAGFPGARLDALVTPGAHQALATCPHLSEIIEFDKHLFDRPIGLLSPARLWAAAGFLMGLRRRRYDLLVICHHLSSRWGAAKFAVVARLTGAPYVAGLDNGRGGFLTHAAADLGFGDRPEWCYWLDIVRPLGIPVLDRPPVFAVPPASQAAADALLADLPCGEGPLVALHLTVGGYAPVKQWPVDRFAAVARRLIDDESATVLLVGGADAIAPAAALAAIIGSGAVDLTGQTSLAILAGVLRRCALVIGNDSGVVHLASAVGARSLAIFGPTNAAAWAPAGARIVSLGYENGVATADIKGVHGVALRVDEPCSPCYYAGFTVRARTPCAHRNCLQHLTVDAVVGVAGDMLSSR